MLTNLLDGLCQFYPGMLVQDLYKAVFQMCMGPEHILQDPLRALEYLQTEYAQVDPLFLPQEPLLMPLGRGVYRLNLRAARRLGVSAEQVGRSFLASGQTPQDRELLVDLVDRLALLDLAELGLVSGEDGEFLTGVQSAGLPPVHHSAAYRQLYQPAYRLVYQDAIPEEWLAMH